MTETKEQRAAIDARGKTIVPASAGSGKTYVMANRYVERVVKEGADVSRMLAVTFTNKAAAQMRERIRKALTEAVAKAEGETRARLKGQLKLLPLADICTIHAFCGRLLRTHFYLADVDPSFRIVGPDDAECRALSSRALDQTFETAYENDPGFSELLSVYFRKKKDRRLREIVLGLYDAARSEAGYRETLAKIAAGEEDLFEEAASSLAADARSRAARVVRKLGELEGISAFPKAEAYAEAVEKAARAVLDATDLFAMANLEAAIPACPRRTQNSDSQLCALLTCVKRQAEAVKAIDKELHALRSREEEHERCRAAGKKASLLAALALSYDGEFTAAKRDAGVLDYADLEHLAFEVLGSREGADLRSRYDDIFVDEYQDVNPMQEKILSALAGERCDVFLVGDKKQAIYGFRGSRSRYFEEREEGFRGEGNVCVLTSNFRSAGAVLRAVNRVFSAVLENYEPMKEGPLYGGYEGQVSICTVGGGKDPRTKERGVYSVKQATGDPAVNPIARKVLEIVEAECGKKEGLGKTWYDVSTGELSPVRYKDIAVLVRKNTKAASAISRALADRGIPVTSSAELNVCDCFEGKLLLDWLSFLDNPEQDIPMAAAMLSVIGGFDERDLALVRLSDRRGLPFRDACREYAAHRGDGLARKLARFFAVSENYRTVARVRTAPEMLRLLLADGLEAQIAAKGESAMRLSHVRRLVAESEGCASVHAFLRRLRDCDNCVMYTETGGENAVHVMTMHAAKGLEFPVVILTELDENFRGPDRDDVMWTDKYHLAPRYFDEEKRQYGETLIRRAAALSMRREELEGERNLLYVAMTRACCRLYLLTEGNADGAGSFYAPEDAKKLSDFLPPGMQADLAAETETAERSSEKREILFRPDEKHVEEIKAAGKPYPFEPSTRVPVKSSATDLLERDGATMYGSYAAEDDDTMPEDDLFDTDMGGSFTPEKGTAYHAFLEHVDFSKFTEEMTEGEAEEALAQELTRMQDEGIFSAGQTEQLADLSRLAKILSLPVFLDLRGKRLRREQKFLVLLPASLFPERYPGADDEIVFQGAIDLLVERGDGKYTVLDYKFSGRSDAELKRHYAVQLKLYRAAVAKIAGTSLENVDAFIVNIARGSVVRM